jgi:hypothetical protein
VPRNIHAIATKQSICGAYLRKNENCDIILLLPNVLTELMVGSVAARH